MTKQVELWSGAFGDQYQQRNLLTPEEIEIRKDFWQNVLVQIYKNSSPAMIPSSFLEIGAGQGPNLAALNKFYTESNLKVQLWATEVNKQAQEKLIENIKDVHLIGEELNNIGNIAELVFTYGVLIHTHPAHLKPLMDQIYKASKRWIVCCEYFAPETRSIPYRGEPDALWLDDYGSKWMDNYPVRCLGYGFCWKKHTKLDNITFWIFEKTEKMH